ncbi:UNVERIFIED_CONTAM: hypothetical protein B566_EDAN019280 [Ephemera danica]|nr:hypothetical protein B566_EDAN019280 [Ephemera danica]
MQTLGEDLVTVLDFLRVKYVIGLGEGAGANALARFAIAHPSRCIGLVLINCSGSAATVMDHFKDKVLPVTSSQNTIPVYQHLSSQIYTVQCTMLRIMNYLPIHSYRKLNRAEEIGIPYEIRMKR